jgi:hypothetical protein
MRGLDRGRAMSGTLAPDVLEDELAVSVARALAAANKEARSSGVEVSQSLITISQLQADSGAIWRINYGPKDYRGRRGGDLIVDVDPADASIRQVLRGQ